MEIAIICLLVVLIITVIIDIVRRNKKIYCGTLLKFMDGDDGEVYLGLDLDVDPRTLDNGTLVSFKIEDRECE